MAKNSNIDRSLSSLLLSVASSTSNAPCYLIVHAYKQVAQHSTHLWQTVSFWIYLLKIWACILYTCRILFGFTTFNILTGLLILVINIQQHKKLLQQYYMVCVRKCELVLFSPLFQMEFSIIISNLVNTVYIYCNWQPCLACVTLFCVKPSFSLCVHQKTGNILQ